MLHYRKTFIALLIASISCTVHAQENPKYDKETEDKIKQVENNLSAWVQIEDSVNTWNLQQRMAHYKIPGLSIAVVHNGKIEWARGYGVMDTATQKPVTVQTLFQAASISKSLNGVGVLKLVQDKKIDLHTDINTYLHTWKFPYDSLCWTTTDATCIQLTSKNFSSKMLFTFHYPLLTDTPFCHTYFLL